MKVSGAVIVFLFYQVTALANNGDTTATSFEIHLKRKADYSLGFNTCSIDRKHIYNLVVDRLQSSGLYKCKSIHDPYVLLKFEDVNRKEHIGHNKQLTENDKRLLQHFNFHYFVKIHGHLEVTKGLGQSQRAVFVLKINVFDANGKLIKRYKARSHEKEITESPALQQADEDTFVNEEALFSLVDEAAASLDLSI